jgi:hypothetical protein
LIRPENTTNLVIPGLTGIQQTGIQFKPIMACFERRWIPTSADMTFVLLARRLNKGLQKTDELRPEETGGKQLSESVLHNAALRPRLITLL